MTAHAFLLLEWNLISRAEYVVGAKIDSMWCSNDALLFDIGITKTDQDGLGTWTTLGTFILIRKTHISVLLCPWVDTSWLTPTYYRGSAHSLREKTSTTD